MITRILDIATMLKPGKALIVYGPRRVGKTTLLNSFLESTSAKYRLDNGDNIRTQQVLGSQDFKSIAEYVSGYELIAIDEAQQITNIGMGIKIIIDQHPDISVIATGSSSFDLAGAVGEPLTGRKSTAILYPIAQLEMLAHCNRHELKENLEEYLVFGSYPEVVSAPLRKEKAALLEELVSSYLLKDVLALDRIKGSKVLLDLLKLVAFQVGSEVSLNELAAHTRIDVKTVAKYLDVLEKAFVIKRIGGFSRNLRTEVVKKAKYFFLDNGIRNAVISQFNGLDSRNDTGQLWENFLAAERIKKCAYQELYGSCYFWRTYAGQEVDWVEERDGKLYGFEFTWSEKKKRKQPAEWKKTYPQASYEIVTKDNYLAFIT